MNEVQFETYFDAIVKFRTKLVPYTSLNSFSFYSNIKLNGNHCKKVSNIEILFQIKSTVNGTLMHANAR